MEKETERDKEIESEMGRHRQGDRGRETERGAGDGDRDHRVVGGVLALAWAVSPAQEDTLAISTPGEPPS